MLKAGGRTADGTPLAFMGLSGENITRLVAGEPIKVNLAEWGLPSCEVVVLYGRTDLDIAAAMQKAWGGGMRVEPAVAEALKQRE